MWSDFDEQYFRYGRQKGKKNLPLEALCSTTEQNEQFYGIHGAEASTALKKLKFQKLFSCGSERL